MKFVRVRSYYPDGRFTSCEQLYRGNDQVKALEKFRAVYPEHDKCILVAECYDSDENAEHFAVCCKCGCVNW